MRGESIFSMNLEVGMIVEGKVTGITKFGAFVDLDGGKTGMVHISEVAPTYVNDIKDYLTEGQTVKVKIITIGEDGKISLSIKKAMPQQPRKPAPSQNRSSMPPKQQSPARPGSYEWQPPKKTEQMSFDEMMNKFKQTSDEKMSDLKRMENKRGGSSRRGNSRKQ